MYFVFKMRGAWLKVYCFLLVLFLRNCNGENDICTNLITITTIPDTPEFGNKFTLTCTSDIQSGDVFLFNIDWFVGGRTPTDSVNTIVDDNFGYAILTFESITRDDGKYYNCKVTLSDGTVCERGIQTLVVYQPPDPPICSAQVNLECHINDAGEPMVYGQIYKGENALQQHDVPSHGSIGRTWSTQIRIKEYLNNNLTCSTSESSYWQDRHNSKSCNFAWIESDCQKQLNSCTNQVNSCTNQLSSCTNQFNSRTNQVTSYTNRFNSCTNQVNSCTNRVKSCTNQLETLRHDCDSEALYCKKKVKSCNRKYENDKMKISELEKKNKALSLFCALGYIMCLLLLVIFCRVRSSKKSKDK